MALLAIPQKLIEVNGGHYRFNINEHFNKDEIDILGIRVPKTFLEKPLAYFQQYNQLNKNERLYAYRLAFYGRIMLDESIYSVPINISSFPLDFVDNFIFLRKLLEEQIDKFNPEQTINRESFKKEVTKEIFSMWMQGYGLLNTFNRNTIGNEQIQKIFNRKGKMRIAEFLAFSLINHPESYISEMPERQRLLKSEESEQTKWDRLLETNNTELTLEIKEFVFGYLMDRIGSKAVIEIEESNGEKSIQTFNSITWGTWNVKSSSLITAANIFSNLRITHVQELIYKAGIIKLLGSTAFKELGTTLQDNIRENLREFVNIYIKKNNLKDVNISRIAPNKTFNKGTTYGEHIDFGDTFSLISTLLDNDSIFIDDRNINDARCRRAILLELTTGARIHEVLLLKRDCLSTNHEGATFIHFHKTKVGTEYFVKATPDMVQWIKELQNLSGNTKISVSSANVSTTFGDDLEEYRLFPNTMNTNIILESQINRFLKKLEKQLKLKSHFSSHDLRKMHALYLKMIGKDKIDIQLALNQKDINSQLPYLATHAKETIDKIKLVATEGVWDEVLVYEELENSIPLEQVMKRARTLTSKNEAKNDALTFIEKIITKVKIENKELPTLNINNPKGMPMYTHYCTASVSVNCGHTELDCFGCHLYKPDQDKLFEHKAEVLRYLVQIMYSEDSAKKNKLERAFIDLNVDDLKKKASKTFSSLFKKFDFLPEKEGKKIEKELNAIANNYYKKNKATKPVLSHSEAMKLIKEGLI
ncbi:phage integrase family protein [Cytobacillus firmus]|uniref:Phage integrase family protein n=2 Tax=Cytobacillus TaxID=2675230 RepID=A0A366JNK2_CYTFI|nr:MULTISPECIES: tyrosine-type recombinase/integrase [Cytobacillus]RBP88976.1 phage integrase family protein [Cytobacillus firmus]TDX47171.1 phage integrase family protein [Cytobacillus oceanisediminis]